MAQVSAYGNTTVNDERFRDSHDDKQALISFRKVAPQVITTDSGEFDNEITFPVANPSPTASSVMDFDGTVLTISERHPTKLSRLIVDLVTANSHNASVTITVNLLVSVDGGTTFPIVANTQTFPLLPKSGSSDSVVFPSIGEWVSPQPSGVPVKLKVQIFADVTSVVSVESGSTFNLDGAHK